jgi:hypothetical protein
MKKLLTAILSILALLLIVSCSTKEQKERKLSYSNGIDLEYQLLYQRGIEAAIWAMPAVSMEFFWDGAFRDFKMGFNDVLTMSKTAEPKHKLLTANDVTPYISFAINLKQDGPVVVEIPAAGDKAVLYGNMVSAWQYEIAAPGPSGDDKGKGGKYLFLPPDYSGDIPEGYFIVESPSYMVTAAFRSIPVNDGTEKDAYEYSMNLKVYPLSQAGSPPATRYIDGSNYNTWRFDCCCQKNNGKLVANKNLSAFL